LPDSTAVDQSTAVLEVRSMSHGKDAEKSWWGILQRDV